MKQCLLILTLLACGTWARADQPQRPNVVVILADDFGYASAGCYGADPKLVRTPNIDRLASEGRKFTDANTTSSVCSPTRYSVLTGRYCWRTALDHEVLGVFSPLHIDLDRLNMASLLKKHGYSTAAVGKWHLGYGTGDDPKEWIADYTAELSPGPLDIGFDYHFAVPGNHGDLTGVFVENRYVYGLRSGKIPPGTKLPGPDADDPNYQANYGPEDTENGKAKILDIDAPRRKKERVMAELTGKATAWISKQPKDKPFFLYFTPVAVHNPVTPDTDLAGQSDAGPYGDWIHELDRSVGAILGTLDKQGVADNTLVIFSSDNGGVFKTTGEGNLQAKAYQAGLRVNGALRGGKHDVWEGGFKVPFLVRWPGKARAGSVCNQMISVVDILATTAAIVGETLPPADKSVAEKAAEDSVNFLPAIVGDPARPIRDDLILHSADGVFAIRKGPWKWIEGEPVDDIKQGARKAHADQYRSQLYNTASDPAETTDMSAQHPEIVQELRALLDRYRNGGYSRALPPEGIKPKEVSVVQLPPPAGKIVMQDAFASLPSAPWKMPLGAWTINDGGLWAKERPKDGHGALLSVPCHITDGVVQYEICFDGANRHSLRIQCGKNQQSFRVEISRSYVGVTKNPSPGEDKGDVEQLVRKRVGLKSKVWYPVRITFRGDQAIVQVNHVTMEAEHAVIGEVKTALNFQVYGDAAGFRNFVAVE